MMKKLLIAVLAALCFVSCSRSGETASEKKISIKPVKGTWLNFVYMDGRNKYTNPYSSPDKRNHSEDYINLNNAEIWKTKVDEMAKLKVEYIIVYYVADQGYAFYPSKFLPLGYNPEFPSPLDAVMDAAAKNNMKVFLCAGWAKNLNEDPRNPEIREMRYKIATELAGLYRDHPAFYGWFYSSVNMSPYVSEEDISLINSYYVKMKSLTPLAKIGVDMYGLSNADFNDIRLEQSLMKIKANVISYRDEMANNYNAKHKFSLQNKLKRLHIIHKNMMAKFWVDCESYTWEDKLNDTRSAYVPAAFERMFLQLKFASEAPADGIISFLMTGLLDMPDSKYPLGQPVYSAVAYRYYHDWISGDLYWQYLENSYNGTLNTVPGVKVKTRNCRQLLDGRTGIFSIDEEWVKFPEGSNEIVFEMPKNRKTGEYESLNMIFFRNLMCMSEGFNHPGTFVASVSDDGKNYEQVATGDNILWPNNKYDSWVEGTIISGISSKKRYVKVSWNCAYSVAIDEFWFNPGVVE